MKHWTLLAFFLLVSGSLFCQCGAAPGLQDTATFTSQTATALLNQVRGGIEGHMQKQMLDAFDLIHMSGGQSFKNQISAFFDRYGSVRIHFHVRETSMQDGKGVVLVDMEMELEQTASTSPPVRKQTQLRLVAENGPKGWKFIDLQPRAFFS